MLRRIAYPTLAVLVATAMTAVTVGTAHGGEPPAGTNAGPPYNYTTELIGDGSAVPLKDQAILQRTKLGYRFRSGQQDGHLVVTRVKRGLRFVDRGTKSFKRLTPACNRKKVRKGIGAVCRVPGSISVRRPLLVEVWPRLGNDYTDASTLPATFAATVLGDKGRDVANFGAGPDFFNGFTGRDRVRGGAGNDWIRPGIGDDLIHGGSGEDDLVAVEGEDTVRGGRGDDRLWTGDGNDRLLGGSGDDRLWAGDGNDRLRGGAGADEVLCGNGRDRARVDALDSFNRSCEVVRR